MNYNTFFLDKISGTDNLIGLNANKFNPHAYLFSNVIKVEEANSSQPVSNTINNQNISEFETGTPPENVIHVSETEITQLSDFISQFITSNYKPLNSFETTQNLSSIELNNNKLILNEDGLTSLISGIVQKIIVQNQVNTTDSNLSVSTNENTKNTKDVTQSLLNLLNQVKSLNLAFKSDSKKISINIVQSSQNIDTTNNNSISDIIETNKSAQNPIKIISKTITNDPINKASISKTIKSNIKKSIKNVNNLPVDKTPTTIYSTEITQIFSPVDNSLIYSSNDNVSSNLLGGDSLTNKFCEENSSISSKQSAINLFVQPVNSSYLNYSKQEITGNFIPDPNSTLENSSTDILNQNAGLIATYTNNTPLIQTTDKQTLVEDKSTIIKVLKNSGTIYLSDLQDNSCFNKDIKIPIKMEDGIKTISINNNINIIPDTNTLAAESTDKEINVSTQTASLKTTILPNKDLPAGQETIIDPKIETELSKLKASLNADQITQAQNQSNPAKIINVDQITNPNASVDSSVKVNVPTTNQPEAEKIITLNNMTSTKNIEQKVIIESNNNSLPISSTSSNTPIEPQPTENSSIDFINDNSNSASSQKQLLDTTISLIQEELSNLKQVFEIQTNTQSSEKTVIEKNIPASSISQVNIQPVTEKAAAINPEETIKNLFSNRKVETKQINSIVNQPQNTIEQLKNIEGFAQSLKKLSLYDNSNAGQNSKESTIAELDLNKIITKNEPDAYLSNNNYQLVDDKKNDFVLNEINIIDQNLISKITLSQKNNVLVDDSKSGNTSINEKNSFQFKVENKEVQIQANNVRTNNTSTSIQNKNQQKINSAAEVTLIDSKKNLNLQTGTEIKSSAKEVKNSVKDDTQTKTEDNTIVVDDKSSLKDSQAKNQDDKNSQNQKFAEIIKNNTVQNLTNANDPELEKLKMFIELKAPNEIVKTVKVSEIIPEFYKAIQQNEKQSLTFQLTPDNLGKVKLVVDLVQNQVNTRIIVENNQIKQFIQSNVEQLKQSLSSTGIDLNSVNISLADHEQKSNKSFSQRKKINGKLESINPTDIQQTLAKKVMGYNTYEYLV